jgi:peptidylprolyl isomerase
VLRRPKGDVLHSSVEGRPSVIDVGRRDYHAAIEYGLLGMQVGGRRSVVVPPILVGYLRTQYELPQGSMVVIELHLIELPERWDPDMESRLESGLKE